MGAPDCIEIELAKEPSTTGAPGRTSWTKAMPAIASASVWAQTPAAVTGRATFGADERAFTLLVEQADPLGEKPTTTFTLTGEDGFQLTRVVPRNSLRVSPK